jgi:hypothetical protein
VGKADLVALRPAELLDARHADPQLPTSLRSRSTVIGCSKLTRIICPPTKSTPKLSPRNATRAMLATTSKVDSSAATLRQRMKSMLVLSGTSLRSRMVE